MAAEEDDRLQLERPSYLGDEHWSCIEVEVERLCRSLDAGDVSQAFGDLKCLVEAVARVTLDIAGESVSPNDAFDSTVNRAHERLADQPGDSLARGGDFARVASQASKIARTLGSIRNQYGGGHGRARLPDVRDEMIDLTLDGSLMWVRWALRRLGLFSEGRPSVLIRDLVEEPKTFRAGVLRRRLEAANLPNLDEHHQQELGVAVGQRTMRNTFVVRADGLEPCLDSDDLSTWPKGYRVGLLRGLWFDPDGYPTLTMRSLEEGLTVLDPLSDVAGLLAEEVQRVIEATLPGFPDASREDLEDMRVWVQERADARPQEERTPLESLASHFLNNGESANT